MRVQPAAIQSRVLRLWAQEAGVRALTAAHLGELSRLLTEWRGQGPIDLPGGYRARRSSGRLELFRSSPPATLE
jgi:tRNA(Ile)-lysidine synthase